MTAGKSSLGPACVRRWTDVPGEAQPREEIHRVEGGAPGIWPW